MSKTWTIWVAAAFAALAACDGKGTGGSGGGTTPAWDEAATKEARTFVEKMFTVWEAQDLDAFTALLAKDVYMTSFDMDLENKPIRMGTREEAVAYAQSMFAEMKKSGGKLTIKRGTIDCRATSSLAYCAMDFEFDVTMPDGAKVSQPTRASGCLRHGADGWKWVQWHSSLAK